MSDNAEEIPRCGNTSTSECLGEACRFFEGKSDSRCFQLGVLPRCSPDLKEKRKQKEVSNA